MNFPKKLKRLAAILLAVGTMAGSVQLPVAADDSTNSSLGDTIPENAIGVDVKGEGSVIVEQNGKETAITEYTLFTGNVGDEITIKASENDSGQKMTAMAVFMEDGTSFNANENHDSSAEYTAKIGTDRYINVLFERRQLVRRMAASYTPSDAAIPSSGSGTLWATAPSMYDNQFTLQWISAPLDRFADTIKQYLGECTHHGWLAWTDDNPYNVKSLNYTYSFVGDDTTKYLTITVADDTTHTGYSAAAGGRAGYQGIQWTNIPITIVIPTKTIHVDVNKVNGNPTITENNDCYSLGGATYGVYLDSGCTNQIGSLTTNDSGQAGIDIGNIDNAVNTVWVKELSPSKGFLIDTNVYTVNLNNNSGSVTSTEMPGNDPMSITLNKTPLDGTYSTNAPSLAGAEFTVRYYAVDPDTYTTADSVSALTPTRTWVLGTKQSKSGKYGAALRNSYKVSGDDFYLDQAGEPVVPLGVLTVEETKAPTGYTLENKILNESNGTSISKTNGIAYFAVKQSGNGPYQVQGGNEYEVQETPYYGKAKIHKVTNINITGSSYSEEEEGAYFAVVKKDYVEKQGSLTYDNVVKAVAAQYGVSTSDVTNRDWLAANVSNYTFDGTDASKMTDHEFAILKTDKDGNAESGDLVLASYELVQLASPSDEISITKDVRDFTLTQNGEVKSFEASNVAELYNIKIVKKDADTGTTVSFNSADFKIYQIKNGKKEYVTQKVGSKKYSTFRSVSDNGKGASGVYYAADDEGGTVTLPLQLRAGTYYIEELKTPDGYLKGTDLKFEVKKANITETDEDGNNYITVTYIDKPVTGTLNVTKKINDVETDTNLLGDSLTKVEFTLTAAEDIKDPATGKVVIKKGETAKDRTGAVVGVFNPDKNGNATLTNLYLGKYTLTESYVPSCFLDSNYSQDVEIKQSDDTTQTVQVSYTVTNTETYVPISKKSVTGQDELPGAKLTITDKDGNVVDSWTSTTKEHTIAGLNRGETYTLNEVIAPNGYVKATSVQFTVKEDGKTDLVTMVDKTFTLKKLDACGTRVAGAEITVYEADDNGNAIIPADGSYVDRITTTADSDAVINNLEEGKTYVAVETKVPDGYVKFNDYTFTVAGADDSGKKTDQTETLTDSQVTVSKEDLGGKEVEGAKLTVTDKTTGKVVDTWTSGKDTHYVNGLEAGKTYTASEDTAPAGYVKSTTVDFTVNDNGVDQKVTMIDTVDAVGKYDDEGNLQKGDSLEVVDANGNVVDTWISGQHIVDLTDEAVMAMTDGQTEYSYTSANGETVTVYTLAKTTDANTGSSKTSGVEDQSGKDYCTVKQSGNNNSGTAKSYVKADQIDHYEVMIKGKDGSVKYANIDTNGDETTHRVSNLDMAEGKYTVRETKAVDGYYFAKDQDITADAADHEYSVINNMIHYQIAKVDDNGDYVKGVTLKLTDITDKDNPAEVELPNEGVTTEEPFVLDGKLIADHTYELEESEYVAGVYKATSLTFTVPHNGTTDVTTITMQDVLTNIAVTKVDNHGTPVVGAKMSVLEAEKDDEGNIVPVTDDEGNVVSVYDFTTTEDYTDISAYVKGSNEESGDVWYILREDEAPFGFEKTEDIPFTVTGTNDESQVIMATDVRKTYAVSAVKVDANDQSKHLKGAEISLFDADGNVVKDINGNDCVGVTDGTGVITWQIEYNGDGSVDTGYYVKETGAPQGYRINKDNFAVTLSEDYDFAKDNPVVITVSDTLLPAIATAVSGNGMIISIAVAAAGIVIVVLLALNEEKKRLKNHNQKH